MSKKIRQPNNYPVTTAGEIQTSNGKISASVQMNAEPSAISNALAVSGRNPTILEIIQKVSENPLANVETLRGLFELQRDFQKGQAEIEFNQAMARLQPKLPRITKHGGVDYTSKKGGDNVKFTFARYEDIDAAVRPLLSVEGFSVSFDQKRIDKEMEYSIRLSHVGGHSEIRTMRLPDDNSGGKNAIQAIGSTITYARRYLLSMILNIVVIGADDDAGGVASINEVQVAEIRELIAAYGKSAADCEARMLESFKFESIETIPKEFFTRIVTALKSKLK